MVSGMGDQLIILFSPNPQEPWNKLISITLEHAVLANIKGSGGPVSTMFKILKCSMSHGLFYNNQ